MWRKQHTFMIFFFKLFFPFHIFFYFHFFTREHTFTIWAADHHGLQLFVSAVIVRDWELLEENISSFRVCCYLEISAFFGFHFLGNISCYQQILNWKHFCSHTFDKHQTLAFVTNYSHGAAICAFKKLLGIWFDQQHETVGNNMKQCETDGRKNEDFAKIFGADTLQSLTLYCLMTVTVECWCQFWLYSLILQQRMKWWGTGWFF